MMTTMMHFGEKGPVPKDHVQLLEELLVEVRGLRRHMQVVSGYVEGLSNKIAAVLEDDIRQDIEDIYPEDE